MHIRERHTSKKRGVRKWLTASEMNAIFGAEAAELIRVRKLDTEELRNKENPISSRTARDEGPIWDKWWSVCWGLILRIEVGT